MWASAIGAASPRNLMSLAIGINCRIAANAQDALTTAKLTPAFLVPWPQRLDQLRANVPRPGLSSRPGSPIWTDLRSFSAAASQISSDCAGRSPSLILQCQVSWFVSLSLGKASPSAKRGSQAELAVVICTPGTGLCGRLWGMLFSCAIKRVRPKNRRVNGYFR